ncbi:MAG: FkbM family methyltransferase [Saprospiraceae bacterium]|nr:FkbM family methyltransferase [Saprospiraceae bacterium]
MLKNLAFHSKIYFFNLLVECRRVLWRMGLKQNYAIRVFDNHSFIFNHFGVITELLYVNEPLVRDNKGFEYETLKKFEEEVKPNFTVLDIGANIGLFSLLGSKLVGNGGRIISFEPSKKTFDACSANLALNGCTNVTVEQLALGDTEGGIFMGNADNDALNFVDPNNAKGEQVRLTTLDNYLKINNIQKVDFIKIDIEGAEYLCFKGAIELLTTHKPKIIMECNERWCKRFGYSVFELLSFLSQFGYQFEQYDEAQWFCYPKN